MRFTVIGHSCLRIETSGPTILVDPWLLGSCYWRSWWHYPTVAEPSPELFAPDFVYLTHHHFDHFHFPSMRRIDREAHVLVPKFGVPTLAEEVRNLGFDEVMELPHAQIVQLAPGVRVASYQNGPDDSVFVVADGEHVLVDINDGKIRGRTLQRILDEFGPPTFVFKSYSFAQAYPVLYTADDPADLELINRDTYLDDWVRVIDELGPRYGVPFGSMVAFLHPESRGVNEQLVAPGEVVDAFRQQRPRSSTEAVQMDPGDSWSSETGFELAGIDWYTDKEKHLEALAERVAAKIADADRARIGDDARLRDVRRLLHVVHARVPARCDRPLRVAPPGGVPRPVVAAALVGPRLPARRGLPPLVTAARHRQHRDRRRSRARRRDRQASDARGARLDADLRAPAAGRRGRRPHLLGAPGAVGARVRAAHRIAAAPAVRGHVAAPVRVVGVGRFAPRQP